MTEAAARSARGRALGALDAVAFAGMFVFGIVMALLGAVMPVLSGRLALGLGDVGTLFLVMNGSMLVASLAVGPAMDRFGIKGPLAAGAAIVAAGLAMMAGAAGPGAMFASVIALGLGGGAINASTNTLVADLHEDPGAKASALNLLGVFFGVGALALPFSIGALLALAGLDVLLLSAAVLCVATAAAAAALTFPPAKQGRAVPFADVARFARMPLVRALAMLLFFESGNEFLLGGYFATFLTREVGVPVGRASYILAAYWASLMAARLVLSRVVGAVGAFRVVIAGAIVAGAGALLVGGAPGMGVATAGMLVTGFALAGVFPTVLGVAGSIYQQHSGTVFGILFTVALTGGMTMPWIAGHLADASGLRAVFVLAAVNFAAVAALASAAAPPGRDLNRPKALRGRR